MVGPVPVSSKVNPADAHKNLVNKANLIADTLNADVLVYSGPISRADSDTVIELCERRARRPNVLLVLSTSGGDPHAAYRIARVLQQHYERFIAFVPGWCKSAGTLILLGAHELVLSPHAELGPLDLQVMRDDEVGERSSVLTPTDALRVLQQHACSAFIEAFGAFRHHAGLPTRLAAETAASMVSNLYAEVYGQIDPMRLGELQRANKIAIKYAERLAATSKNAKDGALLRLVAEYPSHSFVIDAHEAREMFNVVRVPTPEEKEFALRKPISEDQALIMFFNETPEITAVRPKTEPSPPQADAKLDKPTSQPNDTEHVQKPSADRTGTQERSDGAKPRSGKRAERSG